MAKDRTEYLHEYNKKKWAENKEQDSERHGKWRRSNTERRNAYARIWHAKRVLADESKYRDETRRHRLKRKYGITPEDYDKMLLAQGGHCAATKLEKYAGYCVPSTITHLASLEMEKLACSAL
jgi:hypothetical protein